MQETSEIWVWSKSGNSLEGWASQPTLVFLLGESHGQGSLEYYKSIGSQRVRHDFSDLVHVNSKSVPRLIRFASKRTLLYICVLLSLEFLRVDPCLFSAVLHGQLIGLPVSCSWSSSSFLSISVKCLGFYTSCRLANWSATASKLLQKARSSWVTDEGFFFFFYLQQCRQH